MKTLKSKTSIIATVSFAFILLGFFGKKTKSERSSAHQEPVTIETAYLA